MCIVIYLMYVVIYRMYVVIIVLRDFFLPFLVKWYFIFTPFCCRHTTINGTISSLLSVAGVPPMAGLG